MQQPLLKLQPLVYDPRLFANMSELYRCRLVDLFVVAAFENALDTERSVLKAQSVKNIVASRCKKV